MKKLEAGDKVLIIINNELKTGIINSIEEPLQRAYVRLDEGLNFATDVGRLAPVTEMSVETEEKKEPEKIEEITLSENQLIDILAEVSVEVSKGDPFLALPYAVFGAELMNRLFGKND